MKYYFVMSFLFVRERTKENFLRSRNPQKTAGFKALAQADVKFRRFDKGKLHPKCRNFKAVTDLPSRTTSGFAGL
jgi:hypothetical protein